MGYRSGTVNAPRGVRHQRETESGILNMVRTVSIIIGLLIVMSCDSNDEPVVDIELRIFDSACSEEGGYAIAVKNDTLSATRRRECVLPYILIEEASLALSRNQRDTVTLYLSNLKPQRYESDGSQFWEGVRMYILYVNGQEFVRFNSATLLKKEPETEELRELKKIVDYLIELCPLELKRRGFD